MIQLVCLLLIFLSKNVVRSQKRCPSIHVTHIFKVLLMLGILLELYQLKMINF